MKFSFNKLFFVFLVIYSCASAQGEDSISEEIPLCTCGIQMKNETRLANIDEEIGTFFSLRALPDLSSCYRLVCKPENVAKGFIQAFEEDTISETNDHEVLKIKRMYEKLKSMHILGEDQACRSHWDARRELFFTAKHHYSMIHVKSRSQIGQSCAALIEREKSTRNLK